LCRNLSKHSVPVDGAKIPQCQFAHARLEMIFPNVRVLLFVAAPKILFDIFRQVDFLENSMTVCVLRVECAAIQWAKNLFDKLFDAAFVRYSPP